MKVRCLHGYFIFQETKVGQLSDFLTLFEGLEIVPFKENFTFNTLLEAPRYSLAGQDLLGFTATQTFEGEPWEVFEANGVVYDFTTDTVVPIAGITQRTTIGVAGNRFTAPGLILPGSVTEGGRVKDYAAWFSRDRLNWLYSEVSYV